MPRFESPEERQAREAEDRDQHEAQEDSNLAARFGFVALGLAVLIFLICYAFYPGAN